MIKLKSINQKHLEITQLVSANSKRETEIEISFPKTLDFGKDISTSDYFNKNIVQNKSLYKSKNPSLTLLYTKYLGNKNIPAEELKTSLSLFSHQYIQRLKDHISLIKKEKPDLVIQKVNEMLTEVKKILESFRELNLVDEKAISTFKQIDFLLSFETEQFLLKMVSLLQKIKDTSELRASFVLLAEKENLYRISKKYHSDDGDFHLVKDNDDKFIRILNRIEMRKRLIELPLKVSEKIKSSGKKEKYISLGLSTGLIMFVVGFILMQARLLGLDSTLQFVVGLAVLYIFRDLFREEFKEIIYNKIISKRPKTKGFIYVPTNKEPVGLTNTWFFKEDKTQFQPANYKDKISLIYREKIRLTNFEHHNFKRMKTTSNFNISPIMNMIERDSRKLYIYGKSNDNSQVFKLPRQYQINVIVKEKTSMKKKYFQIKEDIIEKEKKYVIIINREKIISIKES